MNSKSDITYNNACIFSAFFRFRDKFIDNDAFSPNSQLQAGAIAADILEM